MFFSQLKTIAGGKLLLTNDTKVSQFFHDSRITYGGVGKVFIALKGKRDGHEFALDAWKKGVRNFITERDLSLSESNFLIVEDCLKALQEIGKHHRKQFDIPVVGITGSNGKTTVKEWLSTLLSEEFHIVKSPKSYNSQIGVPLSLLEMEKSHEMGVFEAGISEKGEMIHLAEMMQPTIGIFTNLGHAHDQSFSTKEEKLIEKLKLFASTDKVICRRDTEYYDEISKQLNAKLITWSTHENADYRIEWNSDTIVVNNDDFEVGLGSVTHFENLTHAIVTSLELGLGKESIQKGLDLIEAIPMRLELKKGINECYILDDSYNNDEAGLRVALDYLASQNQKSKRTVVLSDILHSGKSDSQLYKDIASLLKEKNIDRLIGVGDRITASKKLFSNESLFFNNTEELLKNMPLFGDEMIVVKGARNFELERVVKRLEQISHGTVLEVNFEALHHNLNSYQSLLSPKTKLMVMVKANAYGSGILEVANFLQHQQVNMLGVAYVNEAVQLRKNGIKIPIMIMNPHIESFEQFERYDLQAEIFSFTHLDRLLSDTKEHPRIHLKIDSGMHRLGFRPNEIKNLIEKLLENPELVVEGIFTHFSSSDSSDEDEFTINQAQIFEEVYEKIANAIGYKPIKHACNSPAIVRWPQYHFDMVRLGIGLHGFDPTGQLELRNTSQLKSVVSQIQELKAGDTVGYSRSGKIDKDSKIAIVPIGYEDGYQRIFGNRKSMMKIKDTLCPTIGNICMDMTMVDVTGIDVQEGDEVVVFGIEPTIKDLASWAGTIPYEILTNVSNRVKRVFVSE